MNMPIYITTLVVIVIALLVVAKNFSSIRKTKKHTTKEEDDMYELARHIREGAKVFMKTEYGSLIPVKGKPVGITFVVIIIAIVFLWIFCGNSCGSNYDCGCN